MAVSGLPYALASEASYGPLPGSGWPGHYEILLFLDETRGLEIVEGHRSFGIPGSRLRATTFTDIAETLARAGWPSQAVIVRPAVLPMGKPAATGMGKGIIDAEILIAAIAAAVAESADGHAVIEPDLRAHHNPSRQRVLSELGVTLAHRLATACPVCASPGFGHTSTQTGLPCADCGALSNQASADIFSCATCPHQRSAPRPEATAEPLWCPNCNP